ncbi:BrnA antitoxin family protein [Mesorhizobium sp. CAU 1732]|uniref:BrnA antitoxin family protein n=1 Tax=Mesorhizobium sp. CAU 1732 TaxID=3140358 RepID=UPI003260816D
MTAHEKLKPFPRFETDEEAEKFVAEADLSEYHFSQFKPMQFEFERKSEQVNLRMSAGLLTKIKQRAEARGIPYQRFIREILERAV